MSTVAVICWAVAVCGIPAGPRDTSFTANATAKKVRKKHPEAVLALPSPTDGVREYHDVVYATLPHTAYGSRDLHADIFRPNDDLSYPALIMIHGGGWNSGDKSLQAPMAHRIAAQGYNGSRRHEGKGAWSDTPSDVQAVINIDGNGYRFWRAFRDNVSKAESEGRAWTNLEVRRPRLVFVWGCDNVRVSGVRMINSAFWTSHYYMCDNLTIENCEIQAPSGPLRAASSDAIIRNVTIRNASLKCDRPGVIAANANDTVENFTIENISVKAPDNILRCNNDNVRLADFTVNGRAPAILPADEAMKTSLNYDARDLKKK